MKFLKIIVLIAGFTFSQFDWQDNGLAIRQGVHIEWQRTADMDDSSGFIFAWSDTQHVANHPMDQLHQQHHFPQQLFVEF